MKKKFGKLLAFALAAFLAIGMLAACGDKNSQSSSSQESSSSTEESKSTEESGGEEVNNEKPFEGVTLRYAVSDTATQGGETVELVELVREKTGINIEFTIVPNTNAGEVDKALVMLQAGDELDILYGTTNKLKTYYSAGVLTPVDDLAKADGYDMQGIYSTSLPVMSDGLTYGLPAFNDIWLTMYNKKIFDDANVPYPTAEGWTWEKYIETAKQLTNSDNGIWGSYMLDYDCYNYMWAVQKGAKPYKDEETANFDDPLFAQSLEFFYNLGNVDKIQPDAILYASGQYPWNGFVANGDMGMFVIGGWATSMLPNVEKYPRDWECGLAPMPYPEGEDPSTLAVTGCYAIPTTSKNKEAAFEAIKCIAENQYTLGYARVPARTDLSDEEIMAYIESDIVPNYELDGITAEDFKACWFDNNRTILPEKIVGPADSIINTIWIEEGQLYGMGSKSLEDAVAAIQTRANAAIADEIASNS